MEILANYFFAGSWNVSPDERDMKYSRFRVNFKTCSLEVAMSVLIILGGIVMLAHGNQILDIAHRQVRALSYPEESEMGLFFALAIPLDDPVSTKSISVAFFFEANYKLPSNLTGFQDETKRRQTRSIDRKTIYAVLESKFEAFGVSGKQCLLRSICETSRERHRLHGHNGLIGDLMRITFTPSSSMDEGLPPEYADAERMDLEDDCGSIYHFCPFSIYQYITDVPE